MNVARIKALADFIESVPEENFDMDFYANDEDSPSRFIVCKDNATACGTSCCIAGWQVVLAGFCIRYAAGERNPMQIGKMSGEEFVPTLESASVYDSPFEFSMEYLDLSEYQASLLFLPWKWPAKLEQNNKNAAARLREMAENGTVDDRYVAEDEDDEVIEI